MNIVILCVCGMMLLYLILSLNVSRLRRQGRSSHPPSELEMAKAVRAHGNASEYIPLFTAGLLYLDAVAAAPRLLVTGIAVLALASRTVHPIGLIRAPIGGGRHPFHPLGAIGTYMGLLLLAVALLLHAF